MHIDLQKESFARLFVTVSINVFIVIATMSRGWFLTSYEQGQIDAFHQQGNPINEIAKLIKRHRDGVKHYLSNREN